MRLVGIMSYIPGYESGYEVGYLNKSPWCVGRSLPYDRMFGKSYSCVARGKKGVSPFSTLSYQQKTRVHIHYLLVSRRGWFWCASNRSVLVCWYTLVPLPLIVPGITFAVFFCSFKLTCELNMYHGLLGLLFFWRCLHFICTRLLLDFWAFTKKL